MKNNRSWHRADQGEWEWDCRPDALFRLLADEFSSFRLCVALCRGECKWSTISLKKGGLVYDLFEKIRPGNDLVYDLTEIDTNCQNPRTLREIRIDREFYSCRAVFHAVNGPSIVGSQRLCGEIANRPTINAIQAAMWVSILRTIR